MKLTLAKVIKAVQAAIDQPFSERKGTTEEKIARQEQLRAAMSELQSIKAQRDIARQMYQISKLMGFPSELESIRARFENGSILEQR